MRDVGRRTSQWWTTALHISVGVPSQPNPSINSLLLYFLYPKSPQTSSLHLALYHSLSQFKYSWAPPRLNEALSEGVSFPFSLMLPSFSTELKWWEVSVWLLSEEESDVLSALMIVRGSVHLPSHLAEWEPPLERVWDRIITRSNDRPQIIPAIPQKL